MPYLKVNRPVDKKFNKPIKKEQFFKHKLINY